MTAPLPRAQTAPVSGLSASSPAGTEIGDLVVVVTAERLGAGSGSTLTKVGDASYVEILNHFHNDGSTDGALGVAYKVATVAGAQTYQGFTSSTGSPVAQTGIQVLQKGTFNVDSLPPSATVSQTNNAVPNPPSVGSLTSSRDYLVLAIAAWHLGSAVTNAATAPANYTNLEQFAGSSNLDLAFASRAISAATSEDPGTFGDNQAPNGTFSATIAFINQPERQATAALQDADDSLAATAALEVRGTAALQDDADAIVSTLELEGGELSAVADLNDAADQLAGTLALEIRGTAALQDAVDAIIAGGLIEIRGTAALQDAVDAIIAGGLIEVRSAAALQDDADAIAATLELEAGAILALAALQDAGDAIDATLELEGDEEPAPAPSVVIGGGRAFRRRSIGPAALPPSPHIRILAPRMAHAALTDDDDGVVADLTIVDDLIKSLARRQALELLLLT